MGMELATGSGTQLLELELELKLGMGKSLIGRQVCSEARLDWLLGQVADRHLEQSICVHLAKWQRSHNRSTVSGTEATKVSAENLQRSKTKLKVTRTGRKDYESDYEKSLSSQSFSLDMKNTNEQKMRLVNGKRTWAAAKGGRRRKRREGEGGRWTGFCVKPLGSQPTACPSMSIRIKARLRGI